MQTCWHQAFVQIEVTLKAADKLLAEGQSPWVAIIVRGFKHAPVFWEFKRDSQLHSKAEGKDYVILLLHKKEYVYFILDDAFCLFSKWVHVSKAMTLSLFLEKGKEFAFSLRI